MVMQDNYGSGFDLPFDKIYIRYYMSAKLCSNQHQYSLVYAISSVVASQIQAS